MAQYPKTTGALVTVNIRNANKAGGDGRMKLDAQLIEMMDILHPVGEVKFMMTDQVDPWIEKMAVYNQVWARGDGSLVKVADYPRIFNDIGFKYGWSNTNPNSTYTYTFTDNNGVARSLVIYEDLDIDGNAKPVPEGESPLYFRLPNLAGRFLRCAGTASYVNKWTDTDGTVRQLLTEYKAEMYRGQLDAQRGISGTINVWKVRESIQPSGSKAFNGESDRNSGINPAGANSYSYGQISFSSSRVVPVSKENIVASYQVKCLMRILCAFCEALADGVISY